MDKETYRKMSQIERDALMRAQRDNALGWLVFAILAGGGIYFLGALWGWWA